MPSFDVTFLTVIVLFLILGCIIIIIINNIIIIIINMPPYIYFKAYTQEMLIKSLEFNLNFRAKDVFLTSYQS